MTDWQPIECAPKDRDIIVQLGNGEVFRARYLENGWHAASDIGWVNAMYWIPLPAPPKETP